ncbi:MAG: PAS domain-containing protein, partial [Alphaproteobacteria bacterium]
NYPYSITLKDLDGRHILVNNTYAKSRNVTPEQAIGALTQDLDAPQHSATVALHDKEVMDKRETVLKERETILPNGEKVTRAVIKFPTFDFDGQLTGLGTISTDVSALKQAENALRDSETLLKSIIDNVPSAILVKSVEGRYILVNKVFEEWYGISSKDALGKTTHDLFPKEFADIVTATDQETARLKETESVETDFPFANSNLERIVSTKFFIPGAEDNAMSVGTIVTDITQQRKSEEQLRQAQKMEAVGQLTGGIAHDFNNILGVIIGNLDFLHESLADDADKLLILENAVRAALRGSDLTQRLLAFARKQALVPEIVDLNQLVLGMTELLRRTFGETITIRSNIAAGLWPTEIDPAQFESALLNLATNARHAMANGGQLVMETANIILDQDYADQHEGVIPGPHVMLAVSDTGVGMTDNVLAHAFDPFFTTKDVGEGSGLGLSMVHGFMRQSQGHVSVYSEVGVGTTVKLYFSAKSDAGATQATGAAEDVGATPNLAGPPAQLDETILVVEDDADLRQLTVAIVSHLGYQVREASSGPAALAILAEETPIDLLFTDVILPDNMNGAELAAKARQQRPALKVLYTSGYNENVIVHNGMLDKDIALISKPYRRQELAQRLREILDSGDEGDT